MRLDGQISALAQRVRRLAPSHRDPQKFHDDKWDIALALDRLAREARKQFLEEDCEVDLGNDWKKTSASALFSSWNDYAKAAGEQPGSKRAFAEALVKHGLESHRGAKGVRMYLGVRLTRTSDNSREAA